MEMLFRKIEFWIEGDANKQRKLDASALTPEKFFKKTAKHTLFALISFLIANIFLAYIIGTDALIKIIREPISEHIYVLGSILIFTTAFYSGICPFKRDRLYGYLSLRPITGSSS